jgi:C4-dicarboxylate transporter DctM subunit
VAWISATTDDPIRFLLVVNLLLLVVGTFLEANAALVMLVPILHPAALAVGVDPIQLGALVAVNLCLGLITPPIGLCLNVACKVGELKLEHSLRDIFPFVAAGMVLLVVMSLWPGLSLWLPALVLGP